MPLECPNTNIICFASFFHCHFVSSNRFNSFLDIFVFHLCKSPKLKKKKKKKRKRKRKKEKKKKKKNQPIKNDDNLGTVFCLQEIGRKWNKKKSKKEIGTVQKRNLIRTSQTTNNTKKRGKKKKRQKKKNCIKGCKVNYSNYLILINDNLGAVVKYTHNVCRFKATVNTYEVGRENNIFE